MARHNGLPKRKSGIISRADVERRLPAGDIFSFVTGSGSAKVTRISRELTKEEKQRFAARKRAAARRRIQGQKDR